MPSGTVTPAGPSSLPPSGAASGDLSGTYPSPTVAKVNGIGVSGTPSLGQVPAATGATAATWQSSVLSTWVAPPVVAQSLPRALTRDSISLSNAVLVCAAVELVAGQTVTSVSFYVATAATTPTLVRLGLYNAAFALVASSVNDTALVGSTGVKTKALSAPYAVLASGRYYVGHLIIAANAGAVSGLFAADAVASGPRAGGSYDFFFQSGLADLPDPAVPAQVGVCVWLELT